MAKQDLFGLIDRAIGSRGILRVPSYWVSRILKSAIDYNNEEVLSVREELDSLRRKHDAEIAFIANYPQERYLTAVALEDDMSATYTLPYYYRVNDGSWIEAEANTATPAIKAGERISFKSEPDAATLEENWGCGNFTFSKKIDLLGTPLSMLNGDRIFNVTLPHHAFSNMFRSCPVVRVAKDFLPTLELLEQQEYKGMFNYCTYLVQAPDLPAKILSFDCYSEMFNGCTSLVTAPELPATKLTDGCYYRMFYYCTSLVTAPELPAVTLKQLCYGMMFAECKSLVTAPVLPAKTLVFRCYEDMFSGCNSLNYIKMLATNISADKCLDYWTQGVSSSGTFVKAAGVKIPTGVNGIPSGWTVEEVEV